MSVLAIGKWKEQGKLLIGKYKYVALILLVGILLMSYPNKEEIPKSEHREHTEKTETELCEQLEDILMNIQGAGKVMVLLSEAQGESTVYQTDSTSSSTDKGSDAKSQTVLITDGERNETGLIYQKNPPVYQGAIILAQGADDATVKLAIVEAVSKITGLGANRISVLKMK